MSANSQPEPPQTMAQELPKDFKMPDIVKTAELRKGPVNQRTVTWMNEVQSHLSANGYQMKTTQTSIEEEQANVHMKPINRYIKEDLQLAVNALVKREENREKVTREKAQEVTAAKKRKREETELEMNKKLAQEATEAKKRKREEDEEREQDMNRKLDAVMSELHTLRDTVDKEMGRIHSRVRRKFRKVERKILDVMASRDSHSDDGSDDNNDVD